MPLNNLLFIHFFTSPSKKHKEKYESRARTLSSRSNITILYESRSMHNNNNK